MKRMTVGTAMLAGLAVLPAGAPGQVSPADRAAAQPGTVSAQEISCPEGTVKGVLGITGLDCRGECTLTINEKGEELAWSFSVEPTITGVGRTGPAQGLLRAGDALVSVDGILITTPEGGRRYATVQPGQEVAIRYRRDGRIGEATVRAAGQCVPAYPGPAPQVVMPSVARVAPPAHPPERGREPVAAVVVPRVRVAPEAVVEAPRPAGISTGVSTAVVSSRAVAPVALGSGPKARLGIALTCSDCGTAMDPETGVTVWFFTGPIEVTGVDAGGPADRAGIQIGDLITAVEQHPLETEEGGKAFSDLVPGESVRLAVVKRNGRRVEVQVTPEEFVSVARVSGVSLASGQVTTTPGAVAVVAPAREAVVTPPPSPAPGRVMSAPSEASAPSPTGLPLRYRGAVSGVEIEVRGIPVTVTGVDDAGARVIVISSDGGWIRIRIPEGGE